MALSESPHWAFAVALNATISTANAATLTRLIRWIILDIPTPLSLSAKFCRFMSSSFATSFFAAAFKQAIAMARDFH
jgi:hypothetical protein